MKNTLVVYRISDNRIIHSREQQYGLPLIEDISSPVFDSSSAIFDSSTMDYVVGVNNYDLEDFDDDGVLTDEALVKYGVDSGEVAKYVKDLEIEVPDAARCDDLVFNSETGGITETLLPLDDRKKHLVITVDALNGVVDRGQCGYTGLQKYSPPAFPDTSYMDFLVKKYDDEGNAMEDPEDNETIFVQTNRGLIMTDIIHLAEGEATFRLFTPNESVGVSVSAHADKLDVIDPEIDPGTLTFRIDAINL